MVARDTMRKLFREAKELETRGHTVEEENELKAKAPAIIEAACREQHKENGSVLTPKFCLICMGCPIGTIVEGIGRN